MATSSRSSLHPSHSTPSLRIVVVNPVAADSADADGTMVAQAQRAHALRSGLLASGYDIVASLPADMFLPERIAELQPDMIIIDAESDARDVLEHIVMATRDAPRPMVMFTEDDDTRSMDAAMAAGVSAYVVAGLSPERVKPVLKVAMARFRQDQKVLAELNDTRLKLAERKVVDRAKGLLMNKQALTEDEAYQKLRGMAMNKKMKLADVARRIIDMEDLLG